MQTSPERCKSISISLAILSSHSLSRWGMSGFCRTFISLPVGLPWLGRSGSWHYLPGELPHLYHLVIWKKSFMIPSYSVFRQDSAVFCLLCAKASRRVLKIFIKGALGFFWVFFFSYKAAVSVPKQSCNIIVQWGLVRLRSQTQRLWSLQHVD